MKTLIAIVGMAGSGKGALTKYLIEKLDASKVRFGDVTDEGMAERGLETNETSERLVRESLRDDLGLAAYAIKSWPKIEKEFQQKDVVIADGLYSWEEYLYLRDKVDRLILVHIYTKPGIRYQRLLHRKVRRLKSIAEASERDVAELSNLNKGGPIAFADYVILNNGSLKNMHKQVDKILQEINA